MTGRIVVLGATGYTGGLALDALVRRGLTPTVAGRSSASVAAVAEHFGGLEYAVADAGDAASVRRLVGPGDVLVTTVGPFERYGDPVARAAAEAGAHYLDSTGEVGFVRALHHRYDARAREAGSVMVPAFGYDFVPGVLAGALAGQQGGDAVRSLDIGYFATGPLWRGLSQGTRSTMRDSLTQPAIRWRHRRLVEERAAARVHAFSVRGRRRSAFLVSGTETLFLPASLPALDTVTVYNGWFPALSRPLSLFSAAANSAARHALGRRLVGILTRPMVGPAGGPDAAERSRTRTHVVAVAAGAPGGAPLAEVHLEGPHIYDLTGELLAWAAHHLAHEGGRTPGVVGPLEAFGLDTLRSGSAELGLTPVHR